jgi:hypothetical protein
MFSCDCWIGGGQVGCERDEANVAVAMVVDIRREHSSKQPREWWCIHHISPDFSYFANVA